MPVQSPKRGAVPTPRNLLATAVPYFASVRAPATPPNFIVIPKQISMWGNDVHGDCVTAEEAFAKSCNSPEVFISDNEVIAWATKHGVLEGANLYEVLTWMQNDGFIDGSFTYDDGSYSSVNWADAGTLQSAISEGPVKIGIAADQLQTAWDSTGGKSGWFATGFHDDANEDHCVPLCGYGSISWLAQQLGVQVPAGIDGTKAGYAMFTWNSIGIIDAPSMIAITQEAWLRQPTTVIRGGGLMPAIAAANLSDGRTQVWLIGGNQIQTRWKETTNPSSAWTNWSSFPSPAGATPVAISAARLEDGRPQLFLVDEQNRVWSAWKTSTDPGSAWTSWSPFPSPAGATPVAISAARLEDGRPQLYLVDEQNRVWSAWKTSTDPGSAWTSWSPFPSPAGATPVAISAARLEDGRPQLFLVDEQNRVWSAWKTSTDPGSAWTSWSPFPSPAGATPVAISAAALEDGRPQLFLVDEQNRVWSAWKTSTDPGSAWTSWSPFPSPAGATPVAISAAALEDGRPQLYLVDEQNRVWSAWKTSTDPGSAWTAWSPFS